jgi:hypothetical protein
MEHFANLNNIWKVEFKMRKCYTLFEIGFLQFLEPNTSFIASKSLFQD